MRETDAFDTSLENLFRKLDSYTKAGWCIRDIMPIGWDNKGGDGNSWVTDFLVVLEREVSE